VPWAVPVELLLLVLRSVVLPLWPFCSTNWVKVTPPGPALPISWRL
jgi:hypothetical protein